MLLWDMDYYGDNFEEAMIEEFGEDWEKVTWDMHHEQERKKKEEREQKLKEIFETNPELMPKTRIDE